MHEFIIDGRFPSMNEFIAKMNKNRYAGNSMKQKYQQIAQDSIVEQLRAIMINRKVIIEYRFYEKNKKRDLDNISSFAHKVIQDALVRVGTLSDDGWNNIVGYKDFFYIDKENPRIEVIIYELNS